MAKTINMNESLNNKFIDAIPYEESVLSYNSVLTHNANLLKLAIERIITHKGEGSVQPVDGKAFIHTDMQGKVSVYELQSFGDTIAIHDKDNGSIIMLCDYQDGLVDACEALDIPMTLVASHPTPLPQGEREATASAEEVIVPEASAEDIDEPIAAPIVAPAPVIRSNRRRNAQPVEEPTTEATTQPTIAPIEQPAPVAEAPLSLQGEGRGESLLTIALHANKQGECKTYYVHGKGYKSIPKAVLDKWYPAGKGKATKAHSAFWSKARFEANGGIDALRKELPDMNIEFIDTIEQPAPVPSVSPEVIEQPTTQVTTQPTTEATIAPIAQPTEEGSNTATFPEEKPIAQSDKPAVSPMVKQFLYLKAKHPDAVLLFRCGDFYETYCEDAEKAAKVLGITLTKSSKQKDEKGKPLAMAGFPYHALDTYLPKLIRAGHRVAICDQLEQPNTTTKREVTDVVKPAKVEQPKAAPIQAPADKENGDGSTCGEIVKFSDEMTANIKKFGKHVMGKGTMTFDFNGKDRVNVYIQVDDKHKKMLTEVMEHETRKNIMLVGGISPFLKELAEWDGYLNIENIA